ncbi:MAG: hypothetical protein AAGB51_09425 [Planctomycetota bacterium]
MEGLFRPHSRRVRSGVLNFRGIRRLTEAAHLLALGVWIGVIVGAGLAAAALFPSIRDLDPRVPAYEAYSGEHWLMVGGAAGERIFLYADVAQFVCATGAMLTLIISLITSGAGWRSLSTALRVPLLCAAIGLFSYSMFMHTPEMNEHLRQLRVAAEAGDEAVAQNHREAFRGMHPVASNLLGGTALFAFGAFVAGAFGATRRTHDHEASPDDDLPALAKAGRL